MLIKKFIFNAKYCTAGRPQLLDPRTSDASIVNSTSLLDERKLTLNFCAEAHCDYFSPTVFHACYCCPDVSRKEYWTQMLVKAIHPRYSVMEGWSSGSLKHHKNENENCPNILQLWKWIDDLLQENYGHGRDWCHTDTDQFCWLPFARSQS